MNPIERYADEIPVELKKGINGLDHKVRQAIIVLLIHNHSLSFTEITKLLGLSKGQLSHHLGKLQNSALVRNYSKSDFVGPYDSYYSLSKFGESLVGSLTKSVEPSSTEPLSLAPYVCTQNTLANPSIQIDQLENLSRIYTGTFLNYSKLKLRSLFPAYPETGLRADPDLTKYWVLLRLHHYQSAYDEYSREQEDIPTQAPLTVAPDQRTAAATR